MDSFNHSNKGKVVGLFADEALRDAETPTITLWNQLVLGFALAPEQFTKWL